MLKLTKLTYLSLRNNALSTIISFSSLTNLGTNLFIGFNPTATPTAAPTPLFPIDQYTAICDLIAATNIQTIYTEWSCDASHVPTSSVCGVSGVAAWTGLTCTGGDLVQFSVSTTTLTGE